MQATMFCDGARLSLFLKNVLCRLSHAVLTTLLTHLSHFLSHCSSPSVWLQSSGKAQAEVEELRAEVASVLQQLAASAKALQVWGGVS